MAHGTHSFYAATANVDYVPGYLLILDLLGKIYAPLQAHDPHDRILQTLVRLPPILADTALVAFVCAYEKRMGRRPIAAMVLCASPAVLLLSGYWGQIDALAALLAAFAIIASARGAVVATWIAFALAVILKPQPVVIGPLLLAWQLRDRRWSAPAWAAGLTALATYLVSLPFTDTRSPLTVWSWFLHRYLTGIGKYPVTSADAFNLYALGNHIYQSDDMLVAGLPLRLWGSLIFAVIAITVFVRALTDRSSTTDAGIATNQLMIASFLTLFALFLFTTRMHERYMFVALTIGTIALAHLPRMLWLALALQATFFFNELATLAGFHDRTNSAALIFGSEAIAAVNLLVFGYLVSRYLQKPGHFDFASAPHISHKGSNVVTDR